MGCSGASFGAQRAHPERSHGALATATAMKLFAPASGFVESGS
jgi:hypothetical protein